jgi:hypothetical protein
MNQENANEIFKTEIGIQLEVIYVTSDEKVFIRRNEALLHTNDMLNGDPENFVDTTITEWYNENHKTNIPKTTQQIIDEDFSGGLDMGQIIPKEDLEKEMFELEQQLDMLSNLRWHNSKPKQTLSNIKCTCLRPQVNCFSGMCSYCNRQIVKQLTTEDLKPKQETERGVIITHVGKQETLEEVLKNDLEFIHNSQRNSDFDLGFKTGGIIGAKWQQEQIYNKIKELYDNENITGFSKRAYAQCLDIIEQFKKK